MSHCCSCLFKKNKPKPVSREKLFIDHIANHFGLNKQKIAYAMGNVLVGGNKYNSIKADAYVIYIDDTTGDNLFNNPRAEMLKRENNKIRLYQNQSAVTQVEDNFYTHYQFQVEKFFFEWLIEKGNPNLNIEENIKNFNLDAAALLARR